MSEELFFTKYVKNAREKSTNKYFDEWNEEIRMINSKIPIVPFSNVWVAQQSISRIPENSVLHLGILNTLRCWNYFDARVDIIGYANTGGFGIDGATSTLLGAALANKNKLFFGVIGDLAFFYDLNALGNRHVPVNMRMMVINNGRGTEFRNYGHKSARFGEDADPYMAAAGHFGKQSRDLVKHYVTDLGIEYLSASDKREYENNAPRFFMSEMGEKPIVFEVFTDSADESKAIELMRNVEVTVKGKTMSVVKEMLSDKALQKISDRKK